MRRVGVARTAGTAAGLGTGRAPALVATRVAALLAVVAVVAVALAPAPALAQSDPTAATAQLLAEAAPELGWVRGAPDAHITVVEFSDLSCPYCAQFHADVRERLIAEFVDNGEGQGGQEGREDQDGRVRWISLSYVAGLYPNSLLASEAVECAGQQGAYEAYLELVYGEREGWLRTPRAEALATLRARARTLGLDIETWDACRNDPAVRERIRAVNALAREIGVRGTPTWVVDGFPVMGALPFDYARSFIAARLGEPAATPNPER